jgi:hypothetical protein
MSVKSCQRAALLVLLSVSAGGVVAGEGWFGGVNAAPWAARADMLLNMDKAESGRGLAPAKEFRFTSSGAWAVTDKLGFTGRIGAYTGDANSYSGIGKYSSELAPRPTYGMGIRYDVSHNLRLQGGWDRYHLGSSLSPNDNGVDLLTIGLKYRF